MLKVDDKDSRTNHWCRIFAFWLLSFKQKFDCYFMRTIHEWTACDYDSTKKYVNDTNYHNKQLRKILIFMYFNIFKKTWFRQIRICLLRFLKILAFHWDLLAVEHSFPCWSQYLLSNVHQIFFGMNFAEKTRNLQQHFDSCSSIVQVSLSLLSLLSPLIVPRDISFSK